MKTLIRQTLILVALAVGLSAQTPPQNLKISITVDTSTTEVSLPPQAVAVLWKFVDEMTATAIRSNQPVKYSGLADLLIQHVRDSLVIPLAQRYPDTATQAATAAAEAAKKAAADAAAAAIAPVVIVK